MPRPYLETSLRYWSLGYAGQSIY